MNSLMQANRKNMIENRNIMRDMVMKESHYDIGTFNFRHFQSIVDWLTSLTILNLDFILL